MAVSSVVKNFTDGLVTVTDATGVPIVCTLAYSNGDFGASGLADKWNEVAAYESRGVFNTLRHTNRTYPSGSFTAKIAEFTNAATNVITDALIKNGAWSAATSTGATGTPYQLKLTFTMEGTDFGDSADHSVVFTNCRMTCDISEGDPNTVTVNWTCYGTATGDLAPVSP